MLTSQESIKRQFDLATTALARDRLVLDVYATMLAAYGNAVADRVFGAIVGTSE